jgi:diguanylate cyclase (GGDEF)-like protein
MAAYLVPVAFVGLPDGATLTAVVISVPLAVVVGETLARRTRAMKLADAQCRLAIEALANANLTDDLTGLGNRRQANLMLDRLQPGQALAILDLDHFKSVNDTLGHQRGDQVLIELGAFLSAELDGHQTVARYGGEEFIVVFADLDRNALDDLERLLASWRRRRPAATLSAGLALHHGTSWTDTFARADAALYVAKQAGRDRAVVADPLARAACSNAPLERPG